LNEKYLSQKVQQQPGFSTPQMPSTNLLNLDDDFESISQLSRNKNNNRTDKIEQTKSQQWNLFLDEKEKNDSDDDYIPQDQVHYYDQKKGKRKRQDKISKNSSNQEPKKKIESNHNSVPSIQSSEDRPPLNIKSNLQSNSHSTNDQNSRYKFTTKDDFQNKFGFQNLSKNKQNLNEPISTPQITLLKTNSNPVRDSKETISVPKKSSKWDLFEEEKEEEEEEENQNQDEFIFDQKVKNQRIQLNNLRYNDSQTIEVTNENVHGNGDEDFNEDFNENDWNDEELNNQFQNQDNETFSKSDENNETSIPTFIHPKDKGNLKEDYECLEIEENFETDEY